MFTEPLSLTYAGASKSLPRTGTSQNESVYRLVEAGGTSLELRLSHQFADVSRSQGKAAKGAGQQQRNRAVARLTRQALVSDPLVTGQSVPSSWTATLTIDFPVLVTATDAQALANALTGFLSSGNILKLASGET